MDDIDQNDLDDIYSMYMTCFFAARLLVPRT